ncbi:hypothetical protein JMJ35_001917 [Cladonia borealis]|uniref:BTB domain-containing protein n=1 Tax=Cladonia borealis TaxID=184061 RepID=A0AA39R6R7_9LECA|nr:hypothetical protein JMJ35_001917 [Cladonia borealis]
MAGTLHGTDPAGDVMLLVGPDKMSIRASSKVLSLASPVFDKMLGPHFAEGQALLKKDSPEKSAESPTEITLPDDDPEAMILFCDTIHFRKHATSDIAIPLLAKVASLSEKYDCSLALGSVSEVWLSNLEVTKEGEGCFAKMLWFSYALGNHRAFARISRKMIRECTPNELARQKQEVDCTSLPETIIESAEDIRASDLSNLCDEIGSTLTLHVKKKCPKALSHRANSTLCFNVAKTGCFIHELYRVDLWPIPNTNTQITIQEISDRLWQFNNTALCGPYDFDEEQCEPYPHIDFEKLLIQFRDKILAHGGLCMNCVKKGKIMVADGNCRAKSLESCKGIFE